MQDGIVLSIRHKWVKEILAGEKKWELRRKIPKHEFNGWNQKTVYIYCGVPVQKVVAEFTVGRVETSTESGMMDYIFNELEIGSISWEEYEDYVRYDVFHAIEITNLRIYEEPKELKEFGIKRPPQNYGYTKFPIYNCRHFLRRVKD